jgi:hypothetical protein
MDDDHGRIGIGVVGETQQVPGERETGAALEETQLEVRTDLQAALEHLLESWRQYRGAFEAFLPYVTGMVGTWERMQALIQEMPASPASWRPTKGPKGQTDMAVVTRRVTTPARQPTITPTSETYHQDVMTRRQILVDATKRILKKRPGINTSDLYDALRDSGINFRKLRLANRSQTVFLVLRHVDEFRFTPTDNDGVHWFLK